MKNLIILSLSVFSLNLHASQTLEKEEPSAQIILQCMECNQTFRFCAGCGSLVPSAEQIREEFLTRLDNNLAGLRFGKVYEAVMAIESVNEIQSLYLSDEEKSELRSEAISRLVASNADIESYNACFTNNLVRIENSHEDARIIKRVLTYLTTNQSGLTRTEDWRDDEYVTCNDKQLLAFLGRLDLSFFPQPMKNQFGKLLNKVVFKRGVRGVNDGYSVSMPTADQWNNMVEQWYTNDAYVAEESISISRGKWEAAIAERLETLHLIYIVNRNGRSRVGHLSDRNVLATIYQYGKYTNDRGGNWTWIGKRSKPSGMTDAEFYGHLMGRRIVKLRVKLPKVSVDPKCTHCGTSVTGK